MYSVFSLSRPYHFRFFKDCLPQILLGPFLNAWLFLKYSPVTLLVDAPALVT